MKTILFRCLNKDDAESAKSIMEGQLNGPDTDEGNILLSIITKIEEGVLYYFVKLDYITEIPTSDIADMLIYGN